jgi:hypothetical protein
MPSTKNGRFSARARETPQSSTAPPHGMLRQAAADASLIASRISESTPPAHLRIALLARQLPGGCLFRRLSRRDGGGVLFS